MPLTTTLIALVCGITGAVVLPGLEGASADQLLPRLCAVIMGQSAFGYWLVVLVFAAALAALMSTADSALLSISSIFTRNVYQAHVRPGSSQAELTRVGKLCSWIVVAVLVVAAIGTEKTLIRLLELKFEVLIQIAPCFFLGLYWPRLGAAAVLAGMIAGLAVRTGGDPARPRPYLGFPRRGSRPRGEPSRLRRRLRRLAPVRKEQLPREDHLGRHLDGGGADDSRPGAQPGMGARDRLGPDSKADPADQHRHRGRRHRGDRPRHGSGKSSLPGPPGSSAATRSRSRCGTSSANPQTVPRRCWRPPYRGGVRGLRDGGARSRRPHARAAAARPARGGRARTRARRLLDGAPDSRRTAGGQSSAPSSTGSGASRSSAASRSRWSSGCGRCSTSPGPGSR